MTELGFALGHDRGQSPELSQFPKLSSSLLQFSNFSSVKWGPSSTNFHIFSSLVDVLRKDSEGGKAFWFSTLLPRIMETESGNRSPKVVGSGTFKLTVLITYPCLTSFSHTPKQGLGMI